MIKTVVFAIAAVSVVLLLRKNAPEYAVFASVFGSVAIMLFVLPQALTLINEAQGYFDGLGTGREYFSALVRVSGIALLTQFASDTCRDSGESALASQTEFAGKVLMTLCALPIFRSILQMINNF
ncbi:MAG: hypothetical protein IK118_05885 [Clostridia bacterium]|nr:hypothetical protein [Clostridia bacterium]MBR5427860.1 hypothetical protein [Clostridia bacterium]